jgi:hypothetical protein
MIKKLNWLENDDMTCAPNCVKTFSKLMQINKYLFFTQIIFLNISVNNINKNLIKYKKIQSVKLKSYTPLWRDICLNIKISQKSYQSWQTLHLI